MAGLTKKTVKINLLGRVFPLKIGSDEVTKVQLIEKELNSKLQNLLNMYEGMDKEGALSMALISYAFDLQKVVDDFDEKQIEERLQKVEKTLTSAIHSLT